MAFDGTYDVIIVGGGTAGCILASRLTERSTRSVLVLEAGPRFGPITAFPEHLRSSSSFAATFPGHPYNWSSVATLTGTSTFPVVRGRVVGGSSAVNGTLFTRGLPRDYDGWAAAGNDEWSYDKVLPFFIKSETDHDFAQDTEFHGGDGPTPVTRASEQELTPLSRAFIGACTEQGFPLDRDKNHPDSVGVSTIPTTKVDATRMNVAVTYLEPALERPNLQLIDRAIVRRVLFDGTTAVGVEVEREGEVARYEAGEVVLCAGGLMSPQLLMLSGIGPADVLGGLGIPVLHDAPEVGMNLQEHPIVKVSFHTDPQPPLTPEISFAQVSLGHVAPRSGANEELTVMLSAVTTSAAMLGANPIRSLLAKDSFLRRPVKTLRALRGSSLRNLAQDVRHRDDVSLSCWLGRPRSRGSIVLRDRDPSRMPDVRFDFFEDPVDRADMRHNVRTAVKLLESDAFGAIHAETTDLDPEVLASDAALDRWMTSNLRSAFHSTSTCRMGPATDDGAVVGQDGRAHGIDGLRVVDVSIAPSITSRGPYATAVMMAERAAAFFE